MWKPEKDSEHKDTVKQKSLKKEKIRTKNGNKDAKCKKHKTIQKRKWQ